MPSPSTDPSARTGGASGRMVAANLFFVRLEGRVAALLVGRDGEVRVQSGVRERWRLVRVGGIARRRGSGRIRLRDAEGDRPLAVRVYGRDEADHHDLGDPRPRRAGRTWRPATRQARRQAATRLRAMLSR
ncbi:MAG TPA: hypothetical protein VFX70_03495 [Mycobacteriales bacterium]|nr:hypothetical protein [Mycobacteriales bacterium]